MRVMGSTEIRKATMADNDRIAATLASAFEHDPTFSWLFPNAGKRRARLHGFFAFAGPHLGLVHDETYMTEDATAAATWIPPDKWKQSVGEQLRMLPGMLRWCGAHTPRVLGTLTKMEKAHPHDPPSWYLLALGTEQEHQGKGLGSALMHDMLGRIDELGLPAYLESSNPRNIPFYARHGFVEREPLRFGGDSGPIVTPMWREAR
jgi:GNAT superfamily N-acetyltransferase